MKSVLLASFAFFFTATVQTFDVVSVKPAGPDTRGMSMQTNRGRLLARGATLGFLIQYAYKPKPAQISGGPNWLNTDRFEIEARTDIRMLRDVEQTAPALRATPPNLGGDYPNRISRLVKTRQPRTKKPAQ